MPIVAAAGPVALPCRRQRPAVIRAHVELHVRASKASQTSDGDDELRLAVRGGAPGQTGTVRHLPIHPRHRTGVLARPGPPGMNEYSDCDWRKKSKQPRSG